VPDDNDARREADRLAEDVAKTRARAKEVLAETVQAARMCAATEDQVAQTLDHLAQTQPHHAARLRAKSAFARDQAAYERQWAEDHERATGPSD
jgi:hypothetical protein